MSEEHLVLITSRSFGSTSPEPYQLLQEAGCRIRRNPYDRSLQEDEMVDMVAGVHGLIVGIDRVSERVITAATKLRVISVHGVGVDNIELAAAAKRRIVVANVPGHNATAVAEHTWGLIFAMLRQIPTAAGNVKGGDWQRLLGRGLAGKTLGIIGLGNIGQAVARMAQGFDVHTVSYTPHPDRQTLQKLGIAWAKLEEVISQADILTLHVPLSQETQGLLNKERLSLMKPGAYLVNTSRGGIVDEAALADALRTGRLSAAALDVLGTEPPVPDNPLLSLDNCLITPHMASFTSESITQMSKVAAQNLIQALNGLQPTFWVNPEKNDAGSTALG